MAGQGSFAAKSVTLAGEIALAGPLDAVFPLFSPEGERAWVPGWDPEILHPPGAVWERGMIFRTKLERGGEAVWVVLRLDRAAHDVEYHRVEPEHYVARVTVRCVAAGAGRTKASVTYEFIGLSDAGNAEIAGMTGAAYAAKMATWRGWIDAHLAAPPR
ncbi:MAG: hypothetical protein HY049_02075 [Acidobacteria bacterium]|nr:hypothetical protein [Acidobacteriota bacterium]